MCLCKVFFFFFSYGCVPVCVCVCVCVDRKQRLISKQLEDFDRGVCQIFICVCAKPEGHVGESGRQIAPTPVTMTLKAKKRREEKRREEKRREEKRSEEK